MKKISFRERDGHRRMEIYTEEEMREMSDEIGSVPNLRILPTGMEKDEEKEIHLRAALLAQKQRIQQSTMSADDGESSASSDFVIPTPTIVSIEESQEYGERYNRIYPGTFKLPKNMIWIHPISEADPKPPDYDLDSEDESWLVSMKDQFRVDSTQFERLMESLESRAIETKFPTVPTVDEIQKLHPRIDPWIVEGIYDYWMDKKRKVKGHRFQHQVKTEKDIPINNEKNPYVVFRKRNEKMIQTRNSQRNDVEKYQWLQNVRSSLQKGLRLVSMVKIREELKRDLHMTNLKILEQEFMTRGLDNPFDPFEYLQEAGDPPSQLGTWIDQLLTEAKSHETLPEIPMDAVKYWAAAPETPTKPEPPPKPKPDVTPPIITLSDVSEDDLDEKNGNGQQPGEKFKFVRRRGCVYYAPKEATSMVSQDKRSEFRPLRLTSQTLGNYTKYAGHFRRRLGRGGRVILDRSASPGRSMEHDGVQEASCFVPKLDDTRTKAPVHISGQFDYVLDSQCNVFALQSADDYNSDFDEEKYEE